MRGAAFVPRRDAAEMIDADLEEARRRLGGVRRASAPALQLDAFPVPHGLRDVEHRAGIGFAEGDDARRHPQDVVGHTAQPAVGTGRDVDRVEAPAADQRICRLAVDEVRQPAIEGTLDQAAECAEHAMRMQRAQVERRGPARHQRGGRNVQLQPRM